MPKTPTHSDAGLNREQIEAIVEGKIKHYRQLVYAFALGCSFLFTFLFANQLLSKRKVLVYFHDELFGSDRSLGEQIDRSVALSYNDQFALQAADKPRYLYFYANKHQKVNVAFTALHVGPNGQHSNLLVTIDRNPKPILDDAKDMHLETVNISDFVSNPSGFTPPLPNVHSLSFQVNQASAQKSDTINVQVIVNVSGLETGGENAAEEQRK